MKKLKLFTAVFTTIHQVKLAGLAEPILLNLTKLMGALPSNAGKAS